VQVFHIIGPIGIRKESYIHKDLISPYVAFFDFSSINLALEWNTYESITLPNRLQKIFGELCTKIIGFLHEAILTKKKILVFESNENNSILNTLLRPLQPMRIWLGSESVTKPKSEFSKKFSIDSLRGQY
jgi:hypothetical protein